MVLVTNHQMPDKHLTQGIDNVEKFSSIQNGDEVHVILITQITNKQNQKLLGIISITQVVYEILHPEI